MDGEAIENVVAAAERDGVQHLFYTGVATDGDHLGFALAHRWTEQRIQGSPCGALSCAMVFMPSFSGRCSRRLTALSRHPWELVLWP